MWWGPTVFMALLSCYVAHGDDEEDDIKGPVMPVKPDGSLFDTAELIQQHNNVGESHWVTTEDGYLLRVFRIVPDKSGPVVLLQHGFMASSDCWVTDLDALAFKLSDAGYDVWINNARGNAYSRNHTKLNPDKDKDFWNFSWHEMGAKDLPVVLDFVLKSTGHPHLHYIGHSMGTTIGYVLASTRPEYNAKLKSIVSLAPAAFLSKLHDMLGPDGMAEDIGIKYMDQFKSSGKWEVFPRRDIPAHKETQITCEDIEENFRDMCVEKLDMLQGVLGGGYLPAGQSLKALDHFYQTAVAGKMLYYKMSTPEENKAAYGSEEPPPYLDKFKEIKAPVLMWSSDNDGFIVPQDVDYLKPLLPNVIADNRIKEECFDHVSFLFPRKKSCQPVRAKLYKDIIEALQKLDNA